MIKSEVPPKRRHFYQSTRGHMSAVCINEHHSQFQPIKPVHFTLPIISGCNVARLCHHKTLVQTVQYSQMISLTTHQVFIVCSKPTYHLPLVGVLGCEAKVGLFHLPHSRSSIVHRKAIRHLFHFRVSGRAVKSRIYHLILYRF